jgi:hypothetical protein
LKEITPTHLKHFIFSKFGHFSNLNFINFNLNKAAKRNHRTRSKGASGADSVGSEPEPVSGKQNPEPVLKLLSEPVPVPAE